jgi:hypothetical protein
MKKPRTRSGRKYPRRRLWIERRDAAFSRAGEYCEFSGEFLRHTYADLGPKTGKVHWKWARAVDHIWPERFIRRFCIGADPHVPENLVCVSSALHAKKTAVEWRIFRGDMVGYRGELNRLGFAPELLDRAMKAICESVKK